MERVDRTDGERKQHHRNQGVGGAGIGQEGREQRPDDGYRRRAGQAERHDRAVQQPQVATSELVMHAQQCGVQPEPVRDREQQCG